MSKKLESYSIPELVDIFANKWKLDSVTMENDIVRLPAIIHNGTGYHIYFKGALCRVTKEKLTKKVLIQPDRYLNKYQLNQLVAAVKGEFYECETS